MKSCRSTPAHTGKRSWRDRTAAVGRPRGTDRHRHQQLRPARRFRLAARREVDVPRRRRRLLRWADGGGRLGPHVGQLPAGRSGHAPVGPPIAGVPAQRRVSGRFPGRPQRPRQPAVQPGLAALVHALPAADHLSMEFQRAAAVGRQPGTYRGLCRLVVEFPGGQLQRERGPRAARLPARLRGAGTSRTSAISATARLTARPTTTGSTPLCPSASPRATCGRSPTLGGHGIATCPSSLSAARPAYRTRTASPASAAPIRATCVSALQPVTCSSFPLAAARNSWTAAAR